MVDQLTTCERIANTPIPKSCAYVSVLSSFTVVSSFYFSDGIHLKQCITLYLFALPFTLIQTLQWPWYLVNIVLIEFLFADSCLWYTVVTIVAFTLMGIEGIADEVEMPFGLFLCSKPTDRLLRKGCRKGRVWFTARCTNWLWSRISITDKKSADIYCRDLKEEIEYVLQISGHTHCSWSNPQIHHCQTSRGGEGVHGYDDGRATIEYFGQSHSLG